MTLCSLYHQVYYYFSRKTIVGSLYSKDKKDESSPKVLQEYKWSCLECSRKRCLNITPFNVLESNRKGATSGMIEHLKKHQITEKSHFARIRGYNIGPGKPTYKEAENDTGTWSGVGSNGLGRLNKKEATRRWFVKTRQPFRTIEAPEFQEMFLAHGTRAAYKSRTTLRNAIYDDFDIRRQALRLELALHCISISFTLDMWTSPNRKPIFAIIGHWWNNDFEEREEVLEFVEVNGSHTGEALAQIVLDLIKEYDLEKKLFGITGDNAGNNGTLCQTTYDTSKKVYDDKPSPIGRERMQFHGRASWIRCFAHVIALVCGDILTCINAGSGKDARKFFKKHNENLGDNNWKIPGDESRSSMAKVRFLNLWILRSPQREQLWKTMGKTINRRPIYDVDSRWNSAYDMLKQFLELLPEYQQFVDDNPAIACLMPTNEECVALAQLEHVLEPFKALTSKVSANHPSLSGSLDLYWELEEILNKVEGAQGIYSELDPTIRRAFIAGTRKHRIYYAKLEKNPMIYAAHILDPRCRTTVIKLMQQDKSVTILDDTRKYFLKEWPALMAQSVQLEDGGNEKILTERPFNMGPGQWAVLQQAQAQAGLQFEAQLVSELDRWWQSETIDFNAIHSSDPDFLRKWWKENAPKWPLLAIVARHLLPCSASEVDVERLFSGCRDEIGIRRHALKADTVRVLTLLRSAYTAEDKVDAEQIKSAMNLDLVTRHSFAVMYKPKDRVDGPVPG